MDFVNEHNDQFIQTRVASKEGTRCSQKGGNPYGVTMDSLAADVNSGMGKLRASPSSHYNNCPQKGGNRGHNYDADFGGVGYGYTKSGAAIAGELRGSYAPITKSRSTNMCGGRKKRRKSRRKRRKSRRNKRKSRKSKRGGKRSKRRRSRKSRKSRKSRSRNGGNGCGRFRRSRRKQRGGAYHQFGSNVPNTPSYSSPDTSGSMPWATGPVSMTRKMNCSK